MRRTLTMLSVLAVMVVLASGVALALNQVSCSPPPTDPAADDVCNGTTKSDVIVGTKNSTTASMLWLATTPSTGASGTISSTAFVARIR